MYFVSAMDIEATIPILAALFFRSLGVLVVLPIGEGVLAVVQRTALAFGLALTFGWDYLFESHASLPAYANLEINWYALMFEFVIGVFIVLPLAVLLSVAENFGELLDTVRGQNISSFFDMVSGQQESISGGVCKYGLWAVITSLGGLYSVVVGIHDSLARIPLGGVALIDLKGLSNSILQVCGGMLSGLFVAILPFALVFLAIDFAIGLVTKLKPGFQANQEAFVFKTIVCFVMLIAVLDVAPFDLLVRLAAPISSVIPVK